MSIIPIRHRTIYNHVLDELIEKSLEREKNLQKYVVQKFFKEKVIKELKNHPKLVTTDILVLLEKNFNYKVQHQKKFKHVMKELVDVFPNIQYTMMLNNLYFDFHKEKYSRVLKELKSFSFKQNNFNNYFVELFLMFFLIIMSFNL